MSRPRMSLLAALIAALLVVPASSWGLVIVIDDFDDSDYSDDGLIFNSRTIATSDVDIQVSIQGGTLSILDFSSDPPGWVTLTYSTSSSGVDMIEGGFLFEGAFLGPTGQTLSWTWTASDGGGAVLATEDGDWTAGDDPLFMDPDADGIYTGWKTLVFEFGWSLGSGGGAVSLAGSRLVAVPEPSSLVLCGLGLAMMSAGYRRLRRSSPPG